MSDAPTLVQFYVGWKDDGELSEQGLPVYRQTLMVRLDRPPFLQVSREASEQDLEDYPEPYRLFQKTQKAKNLEDLPRGWPLAMWPVINEFQLSMLAARDVFTVEQLAKFDKRKDIPPEFLELAKRAAEMIQIQQNGGKYEPIIRDLKGQVEALKEQVDDCMKTIATQKDMIQTLKMKVA